MLVHFCLQFWKDLKVVLLDRAGLEVHLCQRERLSQIVHASNNNKYKVINKDCTAAVNMHKKKTQILCM